MTTTVPPDPPQELGEVSLVPKPRTGLELVNSIHYLLCGGGADQAGGEPPHLQQVVHGTLFI